MVVRKTSYLVVEAARHGAGDGRAGGQRRARRFDRLLVVALFISSACTEPTFRDAGTAAESVDGDAGEGEGEGEGRGPGQMTSSSTELDSGLSETLDATSVPPPSLDAAPSAAEDSAAQDVALAAPADSAPADSGGAAEAALPAWAEPLIGSYARRSVTFSYDEQLSSGPGNTRNVEYSILTIAKRGSELELSIQLCAFSMGLEGANNAPLFFKYASRTPPLKGRLLLGAPNAFESEPMVHHLGFDPARGSSCGATGRHERYAEQSWIAGATCQCLGSLLPASINDCRVTDADADDQPGLTLRNEFFGSVAALDVSIAFDYSLTLVRGQVKSNRHHELSEVRTQAAACLNANVDNCDLGHNELCPGGSTRLLPLSGAATCADLRQADFGPLDSFPAAVDCRAR